MAAIHFTDRSAADRTRPQTRRLAQAAVSALPAPSIFNTQPWRWRISDEHATLHADRRRQLSVADPEGRMLTVSCGIALHHATTALAAGGAAYQVERLPDPEDPNLLARVSVTGDRQPTAEVLRLKAAMTRRHTDRRPFADRAPADGLLRALRGAAEAAGAHLHVLRPDQVVQLTVIARRAAAVELTDPRYRAELDTWVYRGDTPTDGIAVAADQQLTNVRPVPLRNLAIGGQSPDRGHDRRAGDGAEIGCDPTALEAGGPPQVADAFARYAVLFTEHDEPLDWLLAGEALSAVLLTATADGLGTSPMSDITEVPAARRMLRQLLADVGEPTLAIRIGVVAAAADDGRRTPRRDPADVITS